MTSDTNNFINFRMDFVYPYNLHDTTYYYYEPPVLDVMGGMQMMDLNAGGGGGPVQYVEDQNNNNLHYQNHSMQYQKIDNVSDYILNDAFIIVDPEFPFIDLPYINMGKNMHGKKQKMKKGYKGRQEKVEESDESSIELVPPEISYDREELMNIAKSPLSQAAPETWPAIAKKLPRLVKREGPTANIIIKEVRAIKKQEELLVAKMATKKTEDTPPIQSI